MINSMSSFRSGTRGNDSDDCFAPKGALDPLDNGNYKHFAPTGAKCGKAEPFRTSGGKAAATTRKKLMLLDFFHDAQHVATQNFVDITL